MRLTTVSILLANIANELGEQGDYLGWNKNHIFSQRLQNAGQPPNKRLKLRLQTEDYEEYKNGLDGSPFGPGAITQAWNITRKFVKQYGVEVLLNGLMRLKVVSISLDEGDDPQQIFESLNATGRPLSVGEKVKNWLLMGLPEGEQQEIYEKYWRKIESDLDATYSPNRIDEFLWNLLKWRTGKSFKINQAYDSFRRWAIRENLHKNRSVLCRELSRLARLYGQIVGTAERHGSHNGSKLVNSELYHLRHMGIDAGTDR